MNLKNITADRLVSLYANRDLSVTEVITSVFDEIDRSDGSIHAFISLCRERALEEAGAQASEALGRAIGEIRTALGEE